MSIPNPIYISEEGYALGRFVKVKNQKKKFGEAESYYAIYLQNSKTKAGACYMFTEHEVKSLFILDNDSADLNLPTGYTYPTTIMGTKGILVTIESKFFSIGKAGKAVKTNVLGTRLAFLSDKKLAKAQARAVKNIEDNVGPAKKGSKSLLKGVSDFLDKIFG